MRARPSALSLVPAKRAGRPKGRFVQHRRLDRLRAVLEREAAGLTLEQLAEAARVSTRSARRYLRELERTMDIESLPLSPGGAHIWRLRPGERARTIPLRPAQARLLAAALPVFEPLRGSAVYEEATLLGEELQSFFGRRTKRAQANAQSREKRGTALWIGHTETARPSFGELTDTLIQAAAECVVTWVRIKEAPQHRRRMRVYTVVVTAGRVFVAGLLEPDRAPSVIPIERIVDADRTEEGFRVPNDFDVTAFLHGEQGVSHQVAGECTLELDRDAAEELRGRRLHPTQRVATRDGRVRVRIPYVSIESLYRLIAPFGAHVTVIEPAAAHEGIAELARLLSAHHAITKPTRKKTRPAPRIETTRVAPSHRPG